MEQNNQTGLSFKRIRYGLWTIGIYVVLFFLMLVFRPSLQVILNMGSGPLIWYIILRLLPLIVGFIFLITGYSALKGDKSQVFPAIVHGVVLVILLADLFQAFVVFGF